MGDAGAALWAEGIREVMGREGLYEGHAEKAVKWSTAVRLVMEELLAGTMDS